MRFASPVPPESYMRSIQAPNGNAPLVARGSSSPTNTLLPIRAPMPLAHLRPEASGALTPGQPMFAGASASTSPGMRSLTPNTAQSVGTRESPTRTSGALTPGNPFFIGASASISPGMRAMTPNTAQNSIARESHAGGALTPGHPIFAGSSASTSPGMRALTPTTAQSAVGRQSLGAHSASLSPSRCMPGTMTPTHGVAAMGQSSATTSPPMKRGLGVSVLPPTEHLSPLKTSTVPLGTAGGYSSGGGTPVSPVGDGSAATSPTPPAAMASLPFGAFPAPTMQVLETKFREIVQLHLQAYVQDLFVSVETSLEKHLSALSGRIEQVEEQWTRSLAAGLANERQERVAALQGLGQEAESLASQQTPPAQVGQSTSTLPPPKGEEFSAVEVRADALEAALLEARTELGRRVADLELQSQGSQHIAQVEKGVTSLRGELEALRVNVTALAGLQGAGPEACDCQPGTSSSPEAVVNLQGTVDRLSATVAALKEQLEASVEAVSVGVGKKIEEIRVPLEGEVREACNMNRAVLMEEVSAAATRTSAEFEARIRNLQSELRAEKRVSASQSKEVACKNETDDAFSDVSEETANAPPAFPMKAEVSRSLELPVEVAPRSIKKEAEVDPKVMQRRNEHLLRLALVQQALSSTCSDIHPSTAESLQQKPRPTNPAAEKTSQNAVARRSSWAGSERRKSGLQLRDVNADVVQRRAELVRCALSEDSDLMRLQPKGGPNIGK